MDPFLFLFLTGMFKRRKYPPGPASTYSNAFLRILGYTEYCVLGRDSIGLGQAGRGSVTRDMAYGVLDRLLGGSGRRGGSSGSGVSSCAVGDTDSRTPVETERLCSTRDLSHASLSGARGMECGL